MSLDPLYVAIIQEMQQIGTAVARLIVNEIHKLHLCNIPGEDVNTLTNIVQDWKEFSQFPLIWLELLQHAS